MRRIIHIDMDCFYAAIEVRDNPRLAGKPVGVGGHPGGRGVLTTANYEARKFGLRSAMPVKTALKLCPQLELVPINFSKYKEESRKIRNIFERHTKMIQPLSLDEAYLDVTESLADGETATALAKIIRHEIFSETGLTASAGIAPNKFLAKVASDWKKPNGQFTVSPTQVADFVGQLPVEKIPGVGKVTSQKLKDLGYYTCEDLQKNSIQNMEHHFGKWGLWLFDICRGIDHRKVSSGGERKSLSLERTFSKDLATFEECKFHLPKMIEDLRYRLIQAKVEERIKGLVIKLKFYDFQQTTFEQCDQLEINLQNYSMMLEEAYYREDKPVRLIGIGVKLKSKGTTSRSSQLSLFNEL